MSNNYGQVERSLHDNEEQKFASAYDDLKHLAYNSIRDGGPPSIPRKGGNHSEVGVKNQWAYKILCRVREDMDAMAELIWDAIEERVRR